MSSIRSRDKLYLPLDNSFNSTSSSTVNLNRWSEVVPPKTALTFAALWDPEDGMVTFSGAALLESEGLLGIPAHPDIFQDDGPSQVFSAGIDRDSDSTTSEDTATVGTFQDAFKAFLHRTPWDSREHLHTKAGQCTPRCLQARASSTFDGLDVYSHDVQIKPRRSLQLSYSDLLDIESSFRTPSAFGRLRLRSDLMLDMQQPESEERESSSGSRPSYLKSRFSTTTTSTSNYVDVTSSALHSVRTLDAHPLPDFRKNEPASPAGSWPSLPQRRRLLRKRRPSNSVPSVPSSVLSTPRKISFKASVSALPSWSPTATASSSTTAVARGESFRGRFPRPIAALVPPAPLSTAPTTPPPTPSKGTRLRLRFSLLSRRKSRKSLSSSPDSEGWVLIEVTPVIQQRFVADLDQD